MDRQHFTARPDWKERFEERGFTFHSIDGKYWIENYAYLFGQKEYDLLLHATQVVHDLCLDFVERVIKSGDDRWFAMDRNLWSDIERSFNRGDFTLYGRFDVCHRPNTPPKFYEYNADTPTSILETGMAQKNWFEEVADPLGHTPLDQLEKKLVQRLGQWKNIQTEQKKPPQLHLLSHSHSLEDFENIQYLGRLAQSVGILPTLQWVDHIQNEESGSPLLDSQGEIIQNIFKLYPWEFLAGDSGYASLQNIQVLEPQWKMLLSNKGLFAGLWHYFSECPFLLPTYLEEETLRQNGVKYVRKPLLSREGASIALCDQGVVLEETLGDYGREGYVYQERAILPQFGGHYTVLGSWIVGHEPAGLMIREDQTWVTKNSAYFIPGCVDPKKTDPY